jgi:hypothetical protein
MPYNASMTTKYKLQLWDNNVISDDIIATYTFTPKDFYKETMQKLSIFLLQRKM